MAARAVVVHVACKVVTGGVAREHETLAAHHALELGGAPASAKQAEERVRTLAKRLEARWLPRNLVRPRLRPRAVGGGLQLRRGIGARTTEARRRFGPGKPVEHDKVPLAQRV